MTKRTVITIANITDAEVAVLAAAQADSDARGYAFGIRCDMMDLPQDARELLSTGFIRRDRISGHRGGSVDAGRYVLTAHGAKWWHIIRNNHAAAA